MTGSRATPSGAGPNGVGEPRQVDVSGVEAAADADSRPYRPCVGLCVFNPAGLVWIGRRIRNDGRGWQMPQGGIDDGETPLTAGLRELAEETGIRSVVFLAETADWLTYELPADLPDPPRWARRYRGQRQKWLALRFVGPETEIDLATEEPEFDAWRWVPLAEVPHLVIPFKRPIYERLVLEFAPFARPVEDGPRSGPTGTSGSAR